MPAILENLVREILRKNKGMSESSAWAIATSQLQKEGKLKKGTHEQTKRK
jgi:hypothetical protein